ncbi:MAG: single-stranded-DNA-specific exonuclease RecJ [Pseudomonas sp.]
MRIEPRLLPDTLPFLGDLPPLLTRLYAARGVQNEAELDKSLKRLIPFEQLKGIDAAVDLLVTALEQRQRILIVGDFDADGATASTVGVLGLRLLGAAHVDYLVPNRFEYGYGLTPEIVEVALTRTPQLLITVDNGISSVEGVAAAKKAGLKVLVTDHHLPGDELPLADAIVNPNQPGCDFPSKALAGVGVIFYVLMALRARLRHLGWYESSPQPNIGELLDLVALGSVADVVPLDANNRILVHFGLKRIREGKARPGIQAIIEVAQREHFKITSTDIGFIIGPRLNAAGRLNDMSLGIECLLSEELDQAREMASQLDEMNLERKSIELSMQAEALALLKDLPEESMAYGLCLYEADWHQGVAGILASRMKERYHRPTIVFTEVGEGMLKGSGRSIQGFHLRDALSVVASKNPELISKYGGHAMAAGLTLTQENYPAFAKAFDDEVRRQLREEDLTGRLMTDGALGLEEFNLELAQALKDAGPWGQNFPEPVFQGVFKMVKKDILKGRHLKVVLQTDCGSLNIDGIAFGIDAEYWARQNLGKVDVVYKLDVNAFRGNETVQLMIAHIEPR